jgi:hypothetical protein
MKRPLRASAERRDNVQRWLSARGIGSRGLVTITLRGYGDMPERNSNIEAWSAFARGFDPGVYFPVFIPNTEQTIEGLPSLMSGLQYSPKRCRVARTPPKTIPKESSPAKVRSPHLRT